MNKITLAAIEMLKAAIRMMQKHYTELKDDEREIVAILLKADMEIAKYNLDDTKKTETPQTRTEKIYTDGACSGNPGPGGWGLVCISDGDEAHPFRMARGFRHTTNNRMELMGAIAALEMPRRTKTSIEIISDSRYVVDAINKGWLDSWAKNNFSKPANPDLWKVLHAALKDVKEKHDISFTWVKGHAGNKWNEMADKLAVEAAAGNPDYIGSTDIDKYFEDNQ